MFNEERVYELGGLLAAGYGLYQARKIHDVELEKSKQRHQEAIELAKRQHENDMKTVKQTYLLELFNSLEQHFQQLNADLIASSRESERDMFDQRNQSFQTIILASSVMFSALASIIVDGNLPLGSGQFLLVAYALTCSLSFSFLFLSIVFCIELVIRTSSFMYKRGRSHTKNLRKAIRDTKGMMRELRGEGRSHGSSLDGLNDLRSNGSLKGLASSGSFADTNRIGSIRRAISQMQPNEIEAEFERHEAEIRGYLKKREQLNDTAAITSYTDEVTGVKKAFKHFWEASCERWWSMAILLFYGGSLNMLLALMIYMWAQFFLFYNSLVAAVIGVSLLGLILVVGIGTVIVMRRVDHKTDKRENEENALAMHILPDDNGRYDNSGSSGFQADENGRLDNSASSAGFGRSGSAWSSLGGLGRVRMPGMPSLGRQRSATSASEVGTDADTSPRFLPQRAPVLPVINTDSTRTMTSTPSEPQSAAMAGPPRGPLAGTPALYPHLATGQPSAPRMGTSGRSHSAPLRHQNTPSAAQTMENLPRHVERTPQQEDIESGSMMTDTSVNSVLTIPPTLGAAEHVFQEEPSPRRRFLSGFGGSGTRRPSGQSPSLYMSALKGSARLELNRQSLHEADRPSPASLALQHPSGMEDKKAHSFRFPKTFPSRGSKSSQPHSGQKADSAVGTPEVVSGGASRYMGRQASSNRGEQHFAAGGAGMAEGDSSSNLSNMSGSGGISF